VCCPHCRQIFQLSLGAEGANGGWLSRLANKALWLLAFSALVLGAYAFVQKKSRHPEAGAVTPPTEVAHVVEQEPPDAVPVETPVPETTAATPTPAPVEGNALDASATPGPAPLDWLREHRDRWPAEVRTTVAVEFPAMYNGKTVGSVKVPAGTVLSLAALEQNTVVASHAGATSRLPVSATDLELRAKAAMAKPVPTPTPIAVVTSDSVSSTPDATPPSEDDEQWKSQFQAGTSSFGKAMATPVPEAEPEGRGHVTYTFHHAKDPDADLKKIEEQCVKSLDEATRLYNKYTKLKGHLDVSYSPGTPTADCSYGGSMRLGASRDTRTVLHEMGHAFGVGTHSNWGKLLVNGVWEGKRANKLLQQITGDPKAKLHGDRMHMWPYGLNYDREVSSPKDFMRSCIMVEAVVKDLESAR
jgi:hypothetical protein